MHSYFKNMSVLGKELSNKKKESTSLNCSNIKKEESIIDSELDRVLNTGIPLEVIHKRQQLTVWERIEALVDDSSFLPLHSLYNPYDNQEGSTAVVDGLAKIAGKWCVVAGFNNRILAGAWISGQAENQLRITSLAKRLNIPLVWLVNCSGVKLTEQEKVYAGRRGNGTTFFRHAELEKEGVPIIAGIYGTNPAGGGYQAISPTYLIAHEKANMAVGGAGIVGGMSPKGCFDLEGAEELIKAFSYIRGAGSPGSTKIHYDSTGFFKEIYKTEKEVLDAIRRCVAKLPCYDLDFFRVDTPEKPFFPGEDLYHFLPFDQKVSYNFSQCLSRLIDKSEHMEFKSDYGPEVYTGIVKISGLPIGVIGNNQGFMPKGYPFYAKGKYTGIGGKLYREGLIKMNEFVTLCGRDRLPIVWFQDTTGIDVGNIAEKSELLGLGQSLIYSIEQTKVPQMLMVLRKGTAAAHYVMGGPTANNHNAFTLGCATTEIYVMHGETAAVASFSGRLVKEKGKGAPLDKTIDNMNNLSQDYYENSRPRYCAFKGFVDEVIKLGSIRDYMVAFVESVYQNPKSICPQHHMITPRIIKG